MKDNEHPLPSGRPGGGRISSLLEKFRQWQRDPLHYQPLSGEQHICHNCGQEFAGNYCPRCSQSAQVGGKIGWSAIGLSILSVFNVESRSLPRTLWHLLWRPGYLIGDYISGKRQQSFPPLKMLLIVALALVLLEYVLRLAGVPLDDTNDVTNEYVRSLASWADKNPAWATLATCCLFIFPTWTIFRYSPRHQRHSLPEGFFIQVFMATLTILFLIISYISDWLLLLVPLYYLIVYRQLFGFGLWGTLWRSLLVLLDAFALLLLALCIVQFGASLFGDPGNFRISTLLLALIIFILLAGLPPLFVYVIRKTPW